MQVPVQLRATLELGPTPSSVWQGNAERMYQCGCRRSQRGGPAHVFLRRDADSSYITGEVVTPLGWGDHASLRRRDDWRPRKKAVYKRPPRSI